jgi:peptidoglycan LD-endopeptidase LytH
MKMRPRGWWWAALVSGLSFFLIAGCDDNKPVPSSAGRHSGPPLAGNNAPAGVIDATPPHPEPLGLVWPTPNRAFDERRDIAAFIQPTVSGDVRSGLFGSVRSGGRQFHEGLDMLSITRDRQREPLDAVSAALPGVVRHISSGAGSSNYGRYVVIEHPHLKPAVYTLYAHLHDVRPDLQVGTQVQTGERIGTMGHTSSGAGIPKERAHLHFEIGVRVTDRFATWYSKRGFGSPNPHGIWNGMNLMGVDPLELFTAQREGKLRSLADFFQNQPAALTLQIARTEEPDFVRRYPEFVDATNSAKPISSPGGWEITVNATGLPFHWRRLSTLDMIGWKPGEVRILKVDSALLSANRGRTLALQRANRWVLGDDLSSLLEQLFCY